MSKILNAVKFNYNMYKNEKNKDTYSGYMAMLKVATDTGYTFKEIMDIIKK